MTTREIQDTRSTTVGLGLLLGTTENPSENSFDDSVKIVTRVSLDAINDDQKEADSTYSAAFSSRVIEPVQDFYQKVVKGDFKATLTLFGIITIARYILLQKSWAASGMAAAQIAAISPFLAAHGMLIIGLIGGAGLVAKIAPYMIAAMRGQTNTSSTTAQSAAQALSADEQNHIRGFSDRIREGVRTGAITVASGAGIYAGRRLTIEGHGRIEAALREADISDTTRDIARVTVIAVPTIIGTAAAYGVLRAATNLDVRGALITAGAAGSAYAVYEGYRYYMQMESEGEAAVRKEAQSAIQQGKTTPVWEMSKGVIEITAGAAFSISSSALLNTVAGSLVTGAIAGAAVTAAERHTVAAWDREGPSLTTGMQAGFEQVAVSSIRNSVGQRLTSWLA